MAIDQREALIAAVRAQVEKEKAEKAAKLKKEQEARALQRGAAAKKEEAGGKPKYKTLTPEELAKIEERKRKKRAEELGIPYEPEGETKPEETTSEAAGSDEPDDDVGETEVLTGGLGGGLGGLGGGLGGLGGGLGGLGGGLGGKEKGSGGLGSKPSGGGLGLNLEPEKASDKDDKVKVVSGKAGSSKGKETAKFSADGLSRIS